MYTQRLAFITLNVNLCRIKSGISGMAFFLVSFSYFVQTVHDQKCAENVQIHVFIHCDCFYAITFMPVCSKSGIHS